MISLYEISYYGIEQHINLTLLEFWTGCDRNFIAEYVI